MSTHKILYQQIEKILFEQVPLHLDSATIAEVERCYQFLESFSKEKVIYGINTGFGPMAQWRVDDKKLEDLQYNIIRSHATGAGEPLPDLYVKAAMIARVGSFLQARSGIHTEVVELLTAFINLGIYPFIPEHGSVGASGDLVQLAHIALTLIGEGEVHFKGEWRPAGDVLRECGLKPISIHIREGLSITNGILDVQYCYEGLEAKSVLIEGGYVNVIATDDGMNVNGGNMFGPGGPSRGSDEPEEETDDAAIYFSSGTTGFCH